MTSLLLTALFGLLLIPVILGGARVYRKISERSASSFEERTARGYIATQIRGADDIYIDSSMGESTINLPITMDGEEYLTKIYRFDGKLYELFCDPYGEFSPEDGQELLDCRAYECEITEGLFILTFEDGEKLVLEVAP